MPVKTAGRERVFVVIDDVCGGVFEELPEGGSGRGVGDGFIESNSHIPEPGFALRGCDVESRVRFAETQPPAVLGLCFVAAEEVEQEGGEFFGGAAEGWPRTRRKPWRVGGRRLRCRAI
jgi:hypothetical protein